MERNELETKVIESVIRVVVGDMDISKLQKVAESVWNLRKILGKDFISYNLAFNLSNMFETNSNHCTILFTPTKGFNYDFEKRELSIVNYAEGIAVDFCVDKMNEDELDNIWNDLDDSYNKEVYKIDLTKYRKEVYTIEDDLDFSGV